MRNEFVKFGLSALALAGLLGGMACTENAAPKSDLNRGAILPDTIQLTQSSGGAVTMAGPGTVAGPDGIMVAPRVAIDPAAVAVPRQKPVLPREAVVVPPKDAKWTIFCTSVEGASHVQQAKQIKAQLAEKTGSDKWYVVHDDEKSSVYYGFYRSIDRGTREGDAAQEDRTKIAAMKNAAGEATMQLSSFLQIDRAAPEAPSEWDLGSMTRNPRQYWSLQIAAYTADASDAEGHDRKWAAVESVRSLRAQGIQAYFFHGESVSSVCVGVWPEEAIKRQGGGNDKGNAGSRNSEATLFVSNVPLPAGVNIPKTDSEGHPIKAMVPKVEILDTTMYEMMHRFPTHMINAEERLHRVRNQATGKEDLVSAPSFLVLVPEVGTATPAPRSSTNITQVPILPPSLMQTDQPLPAQPGVGRLREIGH